ncbi:MAG: hypothetical protein M3328_01480 [Chloroflexota bacterium]|nr:hypothetical protein [Chloroflexota bacterium]
MKSRHVRLLLVAFVVSAPLWSGGGRALSGNAPTRSRAMSIPSACNGLSTQLSTLQQELKELQDDLAVAATGQKGAINLAIHKKLAEISQVQKKLADCVKQNTPGLLPSPTGGAPFKMQGGLVLTKAAIAAIVSQQAANLSVPGGVPKPADLSQTPAPVRNWQAVSQRPINNRHNPPDTQLAVSSTHVVVTFGNTLAWYDKKGVQQGELIGLKSNGSSQLFEPVVTQLAGGVANTCATPNSARACAQSDMRALFDPYRKRFWVTHTAGVYTPDNDKKKRRGIVMLAVSMTEDPKDGWYLYWWDAVTHWGVTNDKVYEPGDVTDFPLIGIDPFGFHYANMVHNDAGASDKSKYKRVVFFNGNQAAQGTPADGWEFWDLKNPDGTPAGYITPFNHHGPTSRAFYVSRYGSDKLLVWALTNPLQPTQKLERVEVTLVGKDGKSLPFNPAQDAPQKDAPTLIRMTNLGSDTALKAVFRAGKLHCVFHDSHDWESQGTLRSSIRLVRLPVSAYPTIPTSGNASYINRRFGGRSKFDDKPGEFFYYGWPAVEVNKDGHMIVVYARSGSTIHPEARYNAYFDNESDIRPSYVLKKGEAVYGDPTCVTTNPATQVSMPCRYRWGDNAGAAVDPSDDTSIWVAQQYANEAGRFEIWVGKIFGP